MRINLFDKLIVLGLLLISSFATAQITVNTNFDPRTNQPIDIRDTLTFLADTSAVTWTYPGLVAYAADADQFWYYTGSFWKRVVQDPFFSNLQDVDTAGIDVDDIAQWDGSNWVMTSPGDVVSAGSDSTNSIYNLLPTQDVLIDPNTNDLIIGSFGAGNSGDFEFFTTNEDGQYAGIFAGTRDSSWLATAGDGFQFDAALFSTGAEDGVMGVNYEYFGTVWNAAVFGDSMLFAPYPGSELNMTINGLPDDPVNPYKVMVQDTLTDRVYLTSIDSLLGSGTAGTLPIWNADGTLGNSSLTEASGVLSSSLTGAFKLPAGTDAQDPVWAAGMLRYNTTANGLQGYNGTAERYLPWASSPTSASGSILYSDGSKLIPSTVLTNRSNEIGIGEWSSYDRGSYSAQIVGSFYIGHYSSPSMTFSGGGQILSSSFTTNITANSPAAGALYARNTNVNNGTMSANFDAADSGQGVWSEIRSSSISQPAYTASFQNHAGSTMLMLRGTTKDSPGHCCGDVSMNKVWRLVETQGYRSGSGYILSGSPIMHRIDLGEASSPSDVDSYIRFYVRKDSVFSEFMRITGGDGSGIGTSVGGVGILTSAPTANLDINGNVRIRTLSDSVAAYIATADASGYLYRATPADIVAAGSGSTSSIYNLLPTQDILIDPNANDLIIGSFGAGNSGDFEFFTTNENGQYVGIFAGTRDSSWLATGEGFQFDAALFSTGAEDGIMGVNYNYFGTVWNAATFGDSVLFAPYPGSELTMTINGLPDDPVNPYKVMVQDTVTDRVYLTSIDSLLGSGTDGNGIYSGSGTVPDSITVNFSGNGVRFDSLGLYGLEITDGTSGPIDTQWKGVLRTLETHTSTNGYIDSGGPGNRSMVAESVVNLTGNASTQHWFNTFYSGIETAPSYSGNLNTGDFAGSPGLLSAQLNAHHKGSGDVTVHGLRVRVNNEGTGTIDKAANILIAGGKNDGGGIYTTEYGIYVDSASSAGTYYGLYDLTGNYFFQSRATPNFDMKFSNVSLSHPFTTTSSAVTTRTFGRITESSADLGGFTFQGYEDSTEFSIGAVRFIGHVGQFSVPSDQEAFEFNAWKWNGGTTRTAMAGADIIASFEAGSTRKFAVNANGVINRDGGKGSVSTTTDGSGDVTVTHGLGGTPDNIQVTITGTTPYVATVHTIGATQFKVRIFDMAGAAVTSTSVSFHWVGEL